MENMTIGIQIFLLKCVRSETYSKLFMLYLFYEYQHYFRFLLRSLILLKTLIWKYIFCTLTQLVNQNTWTQNSKIGIWIDLYSGYWQSGSICCSHKYAALCPIQHRNVSCYLFICNKNLYMLFAQSHAATGGRQWQHNKAKIKRDHMQNISHSVSKRYVKSILVCPISFSKCFHIYSACDYVAIHTWFCISSYTENRLDNCYHVLLQKTQTMFVTFCKYCISLSTHEYLNEPHWQQTGYITLLSIDNVFNYNRLPIGINEIM